MTYVNVTELLKARLALDPKATRWPEKLRLPKPDGRPLSEIIDHEGWTQGERADHKHFAADGETIHYYWRGEWHADDEHKETMQRLIKAARIPPVLLDERAHAGTGGFFHEPKARAEAYTLVYEHPCQMGDDGEFLEKEFRNLAIVGPVGTGKSTLAAQWLVKMMDYEGGAGLFLSAREAVRGVSRPGFIADLACDNYQVVIDDLDSMDLTPANCKALVEVFDALGAHNRYVCFTTSMTKAELQKAFGARGYSRMMNQALVVALDGPDWRLAH